MATDKQEADERVSIEGVITQQDLEDARRLCRKSDWLLLSVPIIAFLVSSRQWSPYEIAGESIKRTVDGSGLWLATRGGPRLIDWEQLYRSRRSDKLVILFARGTPPSFIFPRRLFASDDQWRTFCDLVEKRTL